MEGEWREEGAGWGLEGKERTKRKRGWGGYWVKVKGSKCDELEVGMEEMKREKEMMKKERGKKGEEEAIG